MLNLDDLTYKIRVDDSDLPAAAARSESTFKRIGAAASVVSGPGGVGGLTASTKLTRQEMLALNYTMSDVAASLASGASPFTILLQQGGQVKDTFGGIGPLFSKLGQFVTVGTVSLAAAAVATGSLVYAWMKGAEESQNFEKSMQRTGNAAGITEGQFRSLYNEIARGSGVSATTSRDVLQALIETGQFGPRALKEVGSAAVAMSRAFDLSAADVAKNFASMSDSVAHWAADHSKTMNFLTLDQYKYIRSLEETGRVTEAQAYAAGLVEQAAGRVTRNLGYLEAAWKGVKDWAGQAWNAMLNAGRSKTVDDQIAELEKKLVDYTKRGPRNMGNAFADLEADKLRRQLRDLYSQRTFAQQAAAADADNAARERKAIADERAKEGKKGGPRSTPAPKPDKAYLEAYQAEQKILEEATKATNDYVMAQQAAIDKRNADYQRAVEAGSDYAQQLIDQGDALNASLIKGDEERVRAQLALEKDAVARRIAAFNLLPEQEALAMNRAATYFAARERQITEDLKPEYQKRLELFQDLNRYMKQAADDFNGGFIDAGRNTFAEWLKTGKLSADTLVGYIIGKFAEKAYNRYLAAPMASLGSSIFSLFGGGGGGGFFDSGGLGLAAASFLSSFGLASGGSAAPYSFHRVNELGPELLSVGGRDYLMMGKQGGRVTNAADTAQALGGMSIVVAPVFNGGVTRNELMTGMAAAADMAVGRIVDARRRGDRALMGAA